MGDWLAGRPLKNAKAPLKLLSYVMRMSMRSTPFGLFAAIGALDAGPRQTLRLREAPARTCRFRPDAGWLSTCTVAIESDPQRRARLRMTATDAFREHGDRIYVTNYAVRQSTADSKIALRSPTSIRKTAAVERALRVDGESTRYADVVTRVAAEFAVPQATSRRLVDDLWDAGAFVPDLRPPPVSSALDHVLEHLPTEEHALRMRLLDHRARLDRLNAADGIPAEAEAKAAIAALRAETPELHDVVHVDTSVAFDGTLARRVLEDAAVLGALLLRNGRVLQLRKLQDAWHRRFEGPGVLVPLLDVVDPDVGLGDPGSLEPATTDAPERDAIRIAAAAEALAMKREEIELTGDDVDRWFPTPAIAIEDPAAIELAFTLIASSAAAVDTGSYLICPAPLSVAGVGRSLGRFADLLPRSTMDGVRAAIAPAANDAIHAELIYAPPWARAGNVLARSRLYTHHIDLGVHAPGGERLSTRDLFIGLDERGFYLFSQRYQKRVVLHETHLMVTSGAAPALCRLLASIANQHGVPRPFAWGAAEHFPVLPRVRFGRVILSERRWRLPGHLFAGTAHEAVAALGAWRSRWNCPARVRFGAGDNVLAVNLDVPEFVALIQDQQRAAPTAPVEVREMLETSQSSVVYGGGDAYAAEFLVSLRTRSTDRLSPQRSIPKPKVLGGPPLHGLASAYAYVKLYCAPHQMDRMLITKIAPAAQALLQREVADRWFFIRYADPEPHIRFRLHAVSGAASALRDELFTRTEAWLRDELCSRVTADTYVPETARYGGDGALPFVEHSFMESSRACALALAVAPSDLRDRIRRAAMTAQELFAPAIGRLGIPWWLEMLGDDRPARDRDFRGDLKIVATALGVTAPRQSQNTALDALVDLGERGELAAPLAEVCSALLHMHANRFGIEPKDEPVFRDLIAQSYRSFSARART
jgi:thiopeptide-type bacteriocin biosynthesis protein